MCITNKITSIVTILLSSNSATKPYCCLCICILSTHLQNYKHLPHTTKTYQHSLFLLGKPIKVLPLIIAISIYTQFTQLGRCVKGMQDEVNIGDQRCVTSFYVLHIAHNIVLQCIYFVLTKIASYLQRVNLLTVNTHRRLKRANDFKNIFIHNFFLITKYILNCIVSEFLFIKL